MSGTKPTAGTPFRPVITEITFRTTSRDDAGPAEKYAATFMARTVGHLEKVDVGAIVSAYLEALDEDLDPDDCRDFLGTEILRLTALVETVLDECRAAMRNRLAIDIATTLLPRLKGTA